jgi:hypothetical protein
MLSLNYIGKYKLVLFQLHSSISSLIDFILIDIQKLFTQKQQALSQFNENTLVKGVTALISIIFIINNDCILIFILGIRFIRRRCSNL